MATPAAPAAVQQAGRSRRIVEIASGMNYWTGQEWAPSDPGFTLAPEGDAFVAERVQHRTRLAANLNVAGAVAVSMPEGTVLRSTPVAIGLFDATSGRSAILAGLRDCEALQVSTNQVVYEGAFSENGVTADVVYTLENGSLAQDIVITGRLEPTDYGFPAHAVRLQIYTEFYDPPQPERVRQPVRVELDKGLRERMASPDLVDELLGFGEFVIATGRAVPAGTARTGGEAAAPVVKEFVNRDGRTFLLESVEVASIERELKALPDRRTAATGPWQDAEKPQIHYAAIPTPPRENQVQLAVHLGSERLSAPAAYSPAGVAIDYVATIGGTITGTKIFQGDTTYFVSGPVYCSGTVHIEGGAVFKYPNSSGGGNPTTAFLRLAGSVICKTSDYCPAIFTAGDDEAIGDTLDGTWGGWSGNTTGKHYANPALWFYYN